MNRKHINLYTVIATLLVVLSLGSCKKDSPDPGGTAAQAVAGEWWLQIDGEGDYYHFATYNTAANSSSEMWIDDLETFWLMKGKVNFNVSDLSFSSGAVENVSPDYVGSGETFTLTNGKIKPNIAIGPISKAVTDSISFDLTFSDDAPANGNVYHMKGYRRTRFSEDDH
ncbi:MAG: hypothetical protein JWQ25_675 [Daejeonella sp.]|nr:hypothetical protein [Daejeonella sp.]